MLKFLRLPRAGLRRCIPVYPGDPIAVHIIADSVDLRGFPSGSRNCGMCTAQSRIPYVSLPFGNIYGSRQNAEIGLNLNASLVLH